MIILYDFGFSKVVGGFCLFLVVLVDFCLGKALKKSLNLLS